MKEKTPMNADKKQKYEELQDKLRA